MYTYQLILPGFARCFRERIRTFLERIGYWGVATSLIERGEKLYTRTY
jgi:hypothetical protein